MEFIQEYLNVLIRENQTSLLYFFSTAAQCAAAFAALAAVFAVFRFQAGNSLLDDLYRDSWNWLQPLGHLRVMDVSFSKKRIERELKRMSENTTDPNRQEAVQWHHSIKQLEQVPKILALKVSKPLKLWSYIFFLSLIALLCPKLTGLWNIIVLYSIVLIIGLVVLALLDTRKFIQECLDIKEL